MGKVHFVFHSLCFLGKIFPVVVNDDPPGKPAPDQLPGNLPWYREIRLNDNFKYQTTNQVV
jgi:hypothetical protein